MKRVINFMGIRHAAFAVTVLLTLVSLGSLAVKGLNFGLDFTGGALIELNYEQPADLAKVRGQLAEAGYGDALVQHFGATTDVVVRLQGDDPQLGNRLAADLDKVSAEQFSVKRVEFVGPAVGEELRDQGGLGMLLALGGILIYVAFRFQWKFGFGAIVSLIHDVIVTLGVFSFFQIPFDLTVLAAVLALIGYSLNDTIVVFDRIRENFRVLRKADLIENINISTTQTLLRTLATSISTLLAVVALMVFGGENLWGFSLALFIGVTAGTYSSVYIASILLIWLKLTREDLIPPVEAEEVDDRP
ncbi:MULTISPECIES: protein translocase subunit SecF [Pseudomonadaceae]|jgi:preprotein translocase subunit SecF|uniref:Protein-export membrane protein SecF n=2 Tax=Aquipseudomonas alcaligenes TaxID=43263 RepID=U2ZMI6_AQUA1|nr:MULTISPECIES: protein translocase subunit SecF [Pseudomonas]AMR68135.1 preprotein translocase subunit SecF [Pseudomonas alcaligenes]MDC7823882.1 protein translocase subunit SecF [Pseudomonas sp. BLCC-B13]MDH0141869.1 protein translocase subunit SecF [Pseudomonas alcaligenes]SUD18697.1 preprotein translocase subunit SecF [Pseudomonas alcaligenes]GAD62272.1 preprotein translocase subunit SecF [Pseudomonas alcaligenes NBRC 14159]